MDPCMVRTTYQRGVDVGSSGWKVARRRTMLGNLQRTWIARPSSTHGGAVLYERVTAGECCGDRILGNRKGVCDESILIVAYTAKRYN
jgi:hypothetical protein